MNKTLLLLLPTLSAALCWQPLAGDDRTRFNPHISEVPFEERLIFPVEDQALATAQMDFSFPLPDLDFSEGEIAGVELMAERQLYFDGRILRDTEVVPFEEPLTLMLSKSKYPAEDLHLDAVVWVRPEVEGSLHVRMKDPSGEIIASGELEPPRDGGGLFFSMGFPEGLAGASGRLEIMAGGDVGAGLDFEVLPIDEALPREGRIPLRLLNGPGAVLSNAPFTVGVPFPRGVLRDETHLRLVDADGAEIPLQTRVTARWSRFGYIKWLLCDFTADMAGELGEVFLEYGPDVKRTVHPEMEITTNAGGLPELEAGWIKLDAEGLSFDPGGEAGFQPILTPSGVLGGFVHHEDGRIYVVPDHLHHEVEELGSEKALVRRAGWYVEPDTGRKFCQFVTRMIFHRGSPVVRIFHTWIFTGDGSRDRIHDMGWRFEFAEGIESDGFLSGFDNGPWLDAESLVQFDYQTYDLDGEGSAAEGRTPGVFSGRVGDGVRFFFGVKDFWQNFPSELEVTGEAFTFYNWPRHNPAATFERPLAAEDWVRFRFAHEGEVLDFRLLDEMAGPELWNQVRGRSAGEEHWGEDRPETANAQGIARTEEMFLYLADADVTPEEGARVMQGLDNETLRAVADPAWVAASGAFGEIYHQDFEKYPEDEKVYELVSLSPALWNERLGFYGMWIHGESPSWNLNLQNRTAGIYRMLRKGHHGWPYSWMPFARSGDPRFLKIAEASTRQMIDANFCHYADAAVNQAVGPDYFRRQGQWQRSPLPWAGRRGPTARGYTSETDFMWQAYYLTGDARPRDVAVLFGKLMQADTLTLNAAGRPSTSLLKTFLHLYEATFDPWYIVAAHEVAKLHRHTWRGELFEAGDLFPAEVSIHDTGHYWRPADRDFHRFTQDDAHRDQALKQATGMGGIWNYTSAQRYPHNYSLAMIYAAAYGYWLTEDDMFLQRLSAQLDWARTSLYLADEPDYFQGMLTRRTNWVNPPYFAGYHIRHFPLALAAFEHAGYRPEPGPHPFFQRGTLERIRKGEEIVQEFRPPKVFIKKETPDDLRLVLDTHGDEDAEFHYRVRDAEGTAVLEGSWPIAHREVAWLPGDAEDGVYELEVWGRTGEMRRGGDIAVPVTLPDVPEVMKFEPDEEGGTRVGAASFASQYWFLVPEGLEEFWVEFPVGLNLLTRFTVWNPDGETAWEEHYFVHEEEGPQEPLRAVIPVSPDQSGQLWRITNHDQGLGNSFRIDPAIPPYFSITRAKWFDPR